MRDKDSKYGVRPDDTLATVREVWQRDDILDFCGIMGWDEMTAAINALPITPKETFTDKIKHGDVQITLYRHANTTTFVDGVCPFHFTVEDCK